MITIQNVKKQYGKQILFSGLNVSFTAGQRIGLIGPNGSGKTSLLRMILGIERPDSGVISVPSELSIGYLPQEVETFGSQSPLSIVLEPFAHLLDTQSVYDSVAASLESHGREHPRYRQALEKIGKLQHDLEFHDAFALTSRAKAILAGLGVPEDKWEKPISALSGGYSMRVVLGRLLLLRPDVLLLDEPTNHLDIDSLIWLEKFLERFDGMLVAVSHDRAFLNRMTRLTAEIREGGIALYRGNYDGYMAYKREREESLVSASKNLERKIAQTERFVERFRAKATKASAVQSRVKRIESLKSDLPVLAAHRRTVRFSFPISHQSGSIPLKAEAVAAAYNDFTVFSGIGFTVMRGDKIAILGPNGSGKTTLLKILSGSLQPKSGTIQVGHNVEIRYFGQHVLETLSPEKTLFETIADASNSGERTFIQNTLGAFLFSGDDVNKKVTVLSGGEKSRLALATILSKPGNVLILDEPTNHLDIDSIDVLADALIGFEGTVIFVSHNEYFISRVANRIIEMRPGLFKDFSGSVTQYHEYLAAGYLKSEEAEKAGPKNDLQDEATEKQQRIKLRELRKQTARKIEKLEALIGDSEIEIKTHQNVLDNPVNASNFSLLHETSQKLDAAKEKSEWFIVQWEEAQEILASIAEE
jgi:ATP-binding cassette, subfamily F, member 3